MALGSEKDRNGIDPFKKLFEELSEKERTEHQARILMFRFLSEVEKEMERQGLHRKELAERIGSSQAHLTQLFRGHRLIDLRTIAKIQEALGVKFRVHCGSNQGFDPSSEGSKKS